MSHLFFNDYCPPDLVRPPPIKPPPLEDPPLELFPELEGAEYAGLLEGAVRKGVLF